MFGRQFRGCSIQSPSSKKMGVATMMQPIRCAGPLVSRA
jgi:hypothetical protein